MQVIISSPTRVLLVSYTEKELRDLTKFLTYKDKSTLFMYKKTLNNKWLKANHPASYQEKIAILASQLERSLLVVEDNKYYITPSMMEYTKDKFKYEVLNDYRQYPLMKPMEWKNTFPFKPYEYQSESVIRLLKARHGYVELCTGAGKSFVIYKLAQMIGLQGIIITPSLSIWQELYDDMVFYFGKENVGSYCGVKKDLGKLFTVAVSDSIAQLKEGTEEYKFIRKSQFFIMDESHTIAAETLERMANVILEPVPYRFFVSGTQTDPYEGLLVNNTIGTFVYRLTTREGIDGGYLCPLEFRIVNIGTSDPKYNVKDIAKMKRVHFNENRNIAMWIAKFVNAMWNLKQESTLVLVNDISQIAILNKLITVPMNYIHGNTISKADLEKYGITKVNMKDELFKFNSGISKCLVGTVCIATGTNMYPTHNTINWQGGASEILTRQGTIGRSVRKLENSKYKDNHKPKLVTKVWDFNVHDIKDMSRHLELREKWYRDATDNVKRI